MTFTEEFSALELKSLNQIIATKIHKELSELRSRVDTSPTVFSQLMSHVPNYRFEECVARHGGDSNQRGFSCRDQFLAMVFAQLTYRESLRDIEACLGSMGSKLHHMGFRGKVARSTLADANESHDWRILLRPRPGPDRNRPSPPRSRPDRHRHRTPLRARLHHN